MAILTELLANFPSPEHVEKICRRGQKDKTCRFLVVSDGWKCEKFGPCKEALNKQAESGKMGAKGDNCQGILDILLQHQKELVGKRTEYEESGPSVHLSGTFAEFEIIHVDKSPCLQIWWKPKGREKPEIISNYNLDFLLIDLQPAYIFFEIIGLGSICGTIQIFF